MNLIKLAMIGAIALLTLGGCGEKLCNPGTLAVGLTLDSSQAQADSLEVSVAIAGAAPKVSRVAHSPGAEKGLVEVTFPSGYPVGKDVSFTVTVYRGSTMVAYGASHGLFNSACEHADLDLRSMVAVPDGGTTDGAPDLTGCMASQTDVHNCGACGNDCTLLPGVNPKLVQCVSGACLLIGACQANHQDCDGVTGNGCEADLTKAANCGACNHNCSGSTPLCTSSDGAAWMCSASCGNALQQCGQACVDTSNDVNNCGNCGHACTAPSHATAYCSLGSCGWTCDSGYVQSGQSCVLQQLPDLGTTSAWTMMAPMPATRDSSVAVTASDGRIYVIGGTSDGNTSVNTTYIYTPSTNSWSTAASMSTARANAAGALGSDGKIYVFGGWAGYRRPHLWIRRQRYHGHQRPPELSELQRLGE
jgi:hypothetical protein